jgi:hypothetical protein
MMDDTETASPCRVSGSFGGGPTRGILILSLAHSRSFGRPPCPVLPLLSSPRSLYPFSLCSLSSLCTACPWVLSLPRSSPSLGPMRAADSRKLRWTQRRRSWRSSCPGSTPLHRHSSTNQSISSPWRSPASCPSSTPVELTTRALLSCMFISCNLVLASLHVCAHDAHKVFNEMPSLPSRLLQARFDPLLVVGP